MSCKALGLAIRDQISGRNNDFGMGLPYILMLVSAIFIAVQMNYLNKALDIFSTSIVTPIYYVIFTSLVITASAILFKEWKHMSIADVVGDICGFLVVVIAVVLLNAFRDMDVSMDDVRSQMRPKRKLISLNGHARGSSNGSNQHFEEAALNRQNYGTSSNSDSDRNV
jgi:magnesium transporter